MKKTIVILSLLLLGTLTAVATFAQETSTDEANSVRDTVQRKVEEARTIPFAYIGTVTDIAEETIQINKYIFSEAKEDAGEIQQISVDEENTTFVKITKSIWKGCGYSMCYLVFLCTLPYTDSSQQLNTLPLSYYIPHRWTAGLRV